jgi:hypothetical protein
MVRRYSLMAGVTLVVAPLLALALEFMQVDAFARHRWRDLLVVLLPLAASMSGAVMLDLSLTIGRAAERLAPAPPDRTAPRRAAARVRAWHVALSVAALLLAASVADRAQRDRSAAELLQRAHATRAAFANAIETMADYRYHAEWVNAAADRLALMRVQGGYSAVTLIVRDSIDGQSVTLEFGRGASIDADRREPRLDHVLATGADERAYLDSVFGAGHTTPRLAACRGSLCVMLPVQAQRGVVVLRFVDDGG